MAGHLGRRRKKGERGGRFSHLFSAQFFLPVRRITTTLLPLQTELWGNTYLLFARRENSMISIEAPFAEAKVEMELEARGPNQPSKEVWLPPEGGDLHTKIRWRGRGRLTDGWPNTNGMWRTSFTNVRKTVKKNQRFFPYLHIYKHYNSTWYLYGESINLKLSTLHRALAPRPCRLVRAAFARGSLPVPSSPT